MSTQTKVLFGFESQTGDDGVAVLAWWLAPSGDNDEPVAGGYCATEADCRNDAQAWLALHPEFCVWWRVETRTSVAGKVSTYSDWYHASTASDVLALAAEDAHRYGLPKDATFTARLADADETLICEARA